MLKAGVPMEPVVDPVRMMEAPSRISGNPSCTVNTVPLTFTPKTRSKDDSVILPRGSRAPRPALVQIPSTRKHSLLRCADFRPKAPRSRLQVQLGLERPDVPV